MHEIHVYAEDEYCAFFSEKYKTLKKKLDMYQHSTTSFKYTKKV